MYPTGNPIISAWALVLASADIALGGILNDNIGWAMIAGLTLATDALFHYGYHRVDRASERHDAHV